MSQRYRLQFGDILLGFFTMMNRTYALVLYIIMLGACIYHALYFYPMLSPLVPSNFDFDGNVVGTMAKADMRVLYLSMVGLITLFFPVLAYFLRFVPVSAISLPNREYWLQGDRRTGSLNYLFTTLTYMGAATLVFVQSMFHSCFVADITGEAPDVIVIAGVYSGYLVIHTLVLLIRFRKPKE